MTRLLILLLIFFCSCSGRETKKQEINTEKVYAINTGGCEHKETLVIDTLGNNLVKDKKGNIYFRAYAHPQTGETYTVLISRLFNKCEGDSTYDLSKNIDIQSFKTLGGNYFGDKNKIFFYTETAEGGNIIATDADVNSFKTIPDDFYGVDDDNVYYQGHIMENADPKNFQNNYKLSDVDSVSLELPADDN
jgi:hypothetical protein